MNLLAIRSRNVGQGEEYVGMRSGSIVVVNNYLDSYKFYGVDDATTFINNNWQLLQAIFNSIVFYVVQPDWSVMPSWSDEDEE